MDKLGKIHRLHWKESLQISKIAEFERDLLKINKDIAPQSHEIFKTFVWGGGGTNFGGHRVCKQQSVTFRIFADLYRRTKDVSLSNLARLLIL